MQNVQNQFTTRQKTVSPWIILLSALFMMITVDAVIILGLVQMSSALQVVAVGVAFVLIGLGALFSIMGLSRVKRVAASPAAVSALDQIK